jgi:hypothetical protein
MAAAAPTAALGMLGMLADSHRPSRQTAGVPAIDRSATCGALAEFDNPEQSTAEQFAEVSGLNRHRRMAPSGSRPVRPSGKSSPGRLKWGSTDRPSCQSWESGWQAKGGLQSNSRSNSPSPSTAAARARRTPKTCVGRPPNLVPTAGRPSSNRSVPNRLSRKILDMLSGCA